MKCAEEEHSCGQVRRAGTRRLGALVEQSRLPNGPNQWPKGTGGRFHWKIKTYTCTCHCRHKTLSHITATITMTTITTLLASSCFLWQMEHLQGWKGEGVGMVCVRPQMREGDRVETGGHNCLQQQESSKRGFRQRLFLD